MTLRNASVVKRYRTVSAGSVSVSPFPFDQLTDERNLLVKPTLDVETYDAIQGDTLTIPCKPTHPSVVMTLKITDKGVNETNDESSGKFY